MGAGCSIRQLAPGSSADTPGSSLAHARSQVRSTASGSAGVVAAGGRRWVDLEANLALERVRFRQECSI
jgi:hypothetical protein